MRLFRDTTPPPMRHVAIARSALEDLAKAAQRAQEAWNPSQMEDALRSIEFHLGRIRRMTEPPPAAVTPAEGAPSA
jgi:hypothetical protein